MDMFFKINDYLRDYNVELNFTNFNDVKYFYEEFIRNREQVIDHNFDYFEINCPREFIDEETMIEMDNDYIKLNNDTFLYIDWLSQEIDDLLKKNIVKLIG